MECDHSLENMIFVLHDILFGISSLSLIIFSHMSNSFIINIPNLLSSSMSCLIFIHDSHLCQALDNKKWTQYPALNKRLTAGKIIKDLLSTFEKYFRKISQTFINQRTLETTALSSFLLAWTA